MKEVTQGVKQVDLDDEHTQEEASSIQPEGVPLPDSPSASPEPGSESREPDPAAPDEVDETKDEEHADDGDSVASSAPDDDAEGEVEVEPVTTNVPVEIAPAQEVTIPVESVLHDAPESVEVKA